MSIKCFLDMDGVLDDFVGGASRAHNRPSPYLDKKGLGIFDMEKLWGIGAAEFWAPTNTFEFWMNLEKTPEADEIVELVSDEFGAENVAILTSPSLFPDCINAKRAWIEKHYPTFSKRMIFGSAKEFLAGPNRVLVDDRDRNVEDFVRFGGIGILVPRPWNKLHSQSHRVVDAIRNSIDSYRVRGGRLISETDRCVEEETRV